MSNSQKQSALNFVVKHKTFITISLIVIIAAFFRVWQICELPGGLFPDEAANGIDVNSILQGARSPFFEKGNGREGLFFYLLAISVELFGRGPWQHHIVSALIGIAEVLAAFFLTRRLFGFKTALFAAFFMATSTWHIVLSRTAFRAIMIPLFTTLTFYFIVKFIQDKSNRQKIYPHTYVNSIDKKVQSSNLSVGVYSSILAGVFFALGFYTYIAYRMMPVILGFLLLILIYAKYKNFRQMRGYIYSWKKYLAYSAVAFAIFISPLAHYFWTHPGSFIGRSGQVSVFSKDLNQGDLFGTVAAVVDKTARSFFTEGDLNWRHNVSGMPFLPPTVSVFFLLGIIYALWRSAKYIYRKTDFHDGKYLVLVAWFFAMLVPEIMTAEGIPHGLRLIGVIPAVFIFPAIILGKLFSFLWQKANPAKKRGSLAVCTDNNIMPQATFSNRTRQSHPGRQLIILAIALYLMLIFANSYFAYFGAYANSPEVYYAYRSDLTKVSDYLNARDNKAKTYLSLDKFSVQTVDYLTTETNNPYRLLLPEKSYEAELSPGDQIIFTQSTLFDIIKFKEYHSEAKKVYEEKNKFGQTIMEVYEE